MIQTLDNRHLSSKTLKFNLIVSILMTAEKEQTADSSTPKEAETSIEAKEESVDIKEEKPKPKEYTPEEIEAIAQKVQTPTNNTPKYTPQHILSPEFQGISNYEVGIDSIKKEAKERLAHLKSASNADSQQIEMLEHDLRIIDYLYENYHLGMNVFRTAKGGRDKLRE
jgi:colicin import membrane protein